MLFSLQMIISACLAFDVESGFDQKVLLHPPAPSPAPLPEWDEALRHGRDKWDAFQAKVAQQTPDNTAGLIRYNSGDYLKEFPGPILPFDNDPQTNFAIDLGGQKFPLDNAYYNVNVRYEMADPIRIRENYRMRYRKFDAATPGVIIIDKIDKKYKMPGEPLLLFPSDAIFYSWNEVAQKPPADQDPPRGPITHLRYIVQLHTVAGAVEDIFTHNYRLYNHRHPGTHIPDGEYKEWASGGPDNDLFLAALSTINGQLMIRLLTDHFHALGQKCILRLATKYDLDISQYFMGAVIGTIMNGQCQ